MAVAQQLQPIRVAPQSHPGSSSISSSLVQLAPTATLHDQDPKSSTIAMNFADLPLELVRLILIEAVRLRGYKRGLRLRLVCSKFL